MYIRDNFARRFAPTAAVCKLRGVSAPRPTFIQPCLPILGATPPKGPGWLHQPKWDGYRCILVKDGQRVRLFSKNGTDWTDRLSSLAVAFAELPTRSAVLDGELCLCDDRGRPDFRAFHSEMRQRLPDVSQMAFFAFDLMFEGGVDLRSLSLTERQNDLARLCGKGREPIPHLFLVEAFPEGEPLLEWCTRYRLEGIVSKRRTSGYASGPSRHWVKVKCDSWREANEDRQKLFEGPRKRAAPTERERELQRKREEFARVQERLAGPGLRPGLKTALQAQERELLREIAEIEAETQ